MENQKGNVIVTILAVIGVIAVIGFILISLLTGMFVKKAANYVKENDLTNAPSVDVNQDFSQVTSGNLVLSLNSGDITLDSAASGKVISGQIKYAGEKPSIDYSAQGNTGILTIKSIDKKNKQANLHLATFLPFALQVDTGAGDVTANLANLNLSAVDINSGAGDIKVTFPNKSSVRANINSGAGDIDVTLPQSIGRKVTVLKGNTNNLNLGNDYTQIGNSYKSKNYDTASVKLDITLSSGAGDITLQSF